MTNHNYIFTKQRKTLQNKKVKQSNVTNKVISKTVTLLLKDKMN